MVLPAQQESSHASTKLARDVYSSIIQKVEMPQMPCLLKNRPYVVYPRNRIQYNDKKEWRMMHRNTVKPENTASRRSQS